MQLSSKQVVRETLEAIRPGRILDAPCGKGWLAEALNYDCEIDGIDLYDTPKAGYSRIVAHNLDNGLPEDMTGYDCVCCCEGIEHIGNPLLFLERGKRGLKPGGLIVVTTPNTWYPEARLQYLVRGFFPGFPCLVGRIERGTHMHITPWTFAQLYLYLALAGFKQIALKEEPLSRRKYAWELPLGWPQRVYATRRLRKAQTDEERRFWTIAGSHAAIYGRHLIVTAVA